MGRHKKPKNAVDFVNEERIKNKEVTEVHELDNLTAEQHFIAMKEKSKAHKRAKSKERYHRRKELATNDKEQYEINKHKNIEPNTPPTPLSIKHRRLMSLRQQLTWKDGDISEDDIKVYAEEQLAWALKDDSLNLTGFFMSVGVHADTWREWLAKYPDLKKVHEAVKAIIGQRRENIAIFSRLHQADPGTLHKTLRIYDSTWRQVYDEDVATKLEKPEPIELTIKHHTNGDE